MKWIGGDNSPWVLSLVHYDPYKKEWHVGAATLSPEMLANTEHLERMKICSKLLEDEFVTLLQSAIDELYGKKGEEIEGSARHR